MGKAGQVTCWQAGEGEETEARGEGGLLPRFPSLRLQLQVEVGLVPQVWDSAVQ